MLRFLALLLFTIVSSTASSQSTNEDARTFPLIEVFLITSSGDWSPFDHLTDIWQSNFGPINWSQGTYGDQGGTVGFFEAQWDADQQSYILTGLWQEHLNLGSRGGFRLVMSSDCEFTGERWVGSTPEDSEEWFGSCEREIAPTSVRPTDRTQNTQVLNGEIAPPTGDPILDALFEDPYASRGQICQNANLIANETLGVRYNRMIVWPSGLPSADGYNRSGYGASSGPLAPYYYRIVDELRWRHENDENASHRTRAFYPPIYIDPFHACNRGNYTAMAGEYAIFLNKYSPRVVGDICSSSPEILFHAPVTAQNENIARMFEAQLVGRILISNIAQGDVISIRDFNRFQAPTRQQIFDREVSWIVTLVAAQCGSLPEAIDLRAVRQARGTTLAVGGQVQYETFYQAKIVVDERGIILADTDLTALGERAYRDYYASRAPYRRAEEARRRFERDFGVGAAVFFGLLGAMHVWSPCNDPALSDAERPGFCD